MAEDEDEDDMLESELTPEETTSGTRARDQLRKLSLQVRKRHTRSPGGHFEDVSEVQ